VNQGKNDDDKTEEMKRVVDSKDVIISLFDTARIRLRDEMFPQFLIISTVGPSVCNSVLLTQLIQRENPFICCCACV